MKATGRKSGFYLNLLILQISKREPQVGTMVWPFSSSSVKEEPETERSGYECAPYNVLETTTDYQVRRYPAAKWATVTMTRDHQTPNKSFMKLFGYISGANEAEAKISMTVPVSTKVTNVGGEDGSVQREEMGFYVPVTHQEAPPNPKGEEVAIVTRPEMTVFVRTFGGFAKDKDWEEQRELLMESLKGRDDFGSINTDEYFRQGFDAPFKFWNRKNEVLLVKND